MALHSQHEPWPRIAVAFPMCEVLLVAGCSLTTVVDWMSSLSSQYPHLVLATRHTVVQESSSWRAPDASWSSSMTCACKVGGTATWVPHSMHPSCRHNSSLLLEKGNNSGVDSTSNLATHSISPSTVLGCVLSECGSVLLRQGLWPTFPSAELSPEVTVPPREN